MTTNLATARISPAKIEDSKSRVLQLDILRGVAILLVLCHHPIIFARESGWLKIPATMLTRVGWTGVDLFFVLSGFLIGTILFKEARKTKDLKAFKFYARRAFKLWPAYYILIAVCLIYHVQFEQFSVKKAFNHLAPNLFHVQNYLGSGAAAWTWSLAVEEHFYLLLPVVILLVLKASKSKSTPHIFPFIAVSCMVACLAFRVLKSPAQFADLTCYFPTHLRMDALFCGTLLAYFNVFANEKFNRITKHHKFLLPLGLLLLVPFSILERDEHMIIWQWGFTQIYIAYALILIATLGIRASSFPKSARLIAWIGKYSYPIFLWHILFCMMPLQALSKNAVFTPMFAELKWIIFNTAYIAWAVAFGSCLGTLIDKPALKIREKLFPSNFNVTVGTPNFDKTLARTEA